MLNRRPTPNRASRAAFTLLEMVLASAIGLLILYGLYLAVSVQLKFAEAGRYAVDQATLARSLTARITSDIAPSVGTPDPGRFRSSGQGQNQQGGSGMMGTTTPTGGTTTTPMTGGTGMTGGTTDPSASGTTTTNSNVDANGVPVQAFFGDPTSLRLYVSRVPPSLTGAQTTGDNTFVKSDQRVIEYWVAGNGGLARQEIPVVTAAPDEIPWARGTGNEAQYVIAPEVTGVEFSYWDGSAWQTSWDSTALGSDNKTPVGPPMAIAIVLEITTPATADRAQRVQTYRHVVAIPTANGLPQQSDSTQPMSGSSSGSGM